MSEHRSYFKEPNDPTPPKRAGLKRSGPLKPGKPLTRGKPLKPKAPMKKGPSGKARRDDRTFKAGPRSTLCPRCQQRPAVDASHRAPRSQRPDLRGDPNNRDDLCRPCHEWVEANPEQAKAEGWRDSTTYEAANRHPMGKVRRQLND